MFTILDYSSALEYSIIRSYTNIVYYYLMLQAEDTTMLVIIVFKISNLPYNVIFELQRHENIHFQHNKKINCLSFHLHNEELHISS